jgi:hypothetical protein
MPSRTTMTRSLLLCDAGFEPTSSFAIVGMSIPPLSGLTSRTLSMRLGHVNQLNVFRPRDFSSPRVAQDVGPELERPCHIAGAPDQITGYRG